MRTVKRGCLVLPLIDRCFETLSMIFENESTLSERGRSMIFLGVILTRTLILIDAKFSTPFSYTTLNPHNTLEPFERAFSAIVPARRVTVDPLVA